MSLIEYQGKKRPLSLRLISLSVIVTFLTTQCDLQFAFAFSPALPPVMKITDQSHLGSNEATEDVHHMQDFGARRIEKDMKQSVQKFKADTDFIPEPEPFTGFVNVEQPVQNKSGEVSCQDDGNTTTCKVPNAESKDCSPPDSKCAYY